MPLLHSYLPSLTPLSRVAGGPACDHHQPDGDPTGGRVGPHHIVPRHQWIDECEEVWGEYSPLAVV